MKIICILLLALTHCQIEHPLTNSLSTAQPQILVDLNKINHILTSLLTLIQKISAAFSYFINSTTGFVKGLQTFISLMSWIFSGEHIMIVTLTVTFLILLTDE